jgi:signal transduction histidine kinase
MFGSPTEEIIDRKIQTLIVPEERDKQQSLEDLFDNFNSPFLARGHRKIGSDFPLEISVSKLPSENRKMLIFRDITERQQAQNKLESHIKELSRLSLMLSKANQTLSERNQELDQFAYVASHDLKAPLRAISSLSEWIEEDLGDKLAPDTQYQMQLLRQRVSRMEALINGLLEYCRVGRSQTKTETVDVDLLLKEIVDSIGVPPTFKVEIQPGMPKLIAKTLLLRQVFANLISNAIKHQGSSEGNVIISFKELDKFYEFAVTDTGPGIAPEYQEQIFKIFQTLEARDTQENTGIGLAIVKKIVESEGGKIELSSDLGIGSTFSFTWRKEPRD